MRKKILQYLLANNTEIDIVNIILNAYRIECLLFLNIMFADVDM